MHPAITQIAKCDSFNIFKLQQFHALVVQCLTNEGHRSIVSEENFRQYEFRRVKLYKTKQTKRLPSQLRYLNLPTNTTKYKANKISGEKDLSINILSVKSLDLSHIQKIESTQQLFSYLFDLLSVTRQVV